MKLEELDQLEEKKKKKIITNYLIQSRRYPRAFFVRKNSILSTKEAIIFIAIE